MIIVIVIWDSEDNIAINIKIPFVIYTDMPRKRLENKKDGASKYEADPEPASELYSYERQYVEVVKEEVVVFIYDYDNDEDKGTIQIHPYNNKRGGIGMEEKGAGLIRIWKKIRETSIQSIGEQRRVWRELSMIPMKKIIRGMN